MVETSGLNGLKYLIILHIEAVVRRCSVQALRLQLYLKKGPRHRFSFKFCHISKNTFLHRTPLVATSLHIIFLQCIICLNFGVSILINVA